MINGIMDMVEGVHGNHFVDYAARMAEANAAGRRRAELEHRDRRRHVPATFPFTEAWWVVELIREDGGNLFCGAPPSLDGGELCGWHDTADAGYQFRRRMDAERFAAAIGQTCVGECIAVERGAVSPADDGPSD